MLQKGQQFGLKGRNETEIGYFKYFEAGYETREYWSGAIPGTVSHVEHLGGETNIFVRTERHGLLTVRKFGEHRLAVDELVHLTPDASRQFLFDAEGRRIRQTRHAA